MLSNLLAIPYEVYQKIQLSMLIITALCAIFVVIVVLIQPGNSNGVKAVTGSSTDTFYGKNKAKTLVNKLKKLTFVCLAVMAILMVTFFLFDLLLPVGR